MNRSYRVLSASARPLSLGAVAVFFLMVTAPPAAAAFTECRPLTHPGNGGQIVIDEPGVYCLVEDIRITSGVSGAFVLIESPHVTLDLNGHSIRQTGEGEGTGFGILVQRSSVSIRNGQVSGFSVGIWLQGCPSSDFRSAQLIEEVHLERSRDIGAILGCSGTTFRRNRVTHTGFDRSSAVAVTVLGTQNELLDNYIGQVGSSSERENFAIQFGENARDNITVGNRIFRTYHGIVAVEGAATHCGDNYTAGVADKYSGCIDHGNNY